MKGFIHFFKTRGLHVKCVEFAVFLWIVLNIAHQLVNACFDEQEAYQVNQAIEFARSSTMSQARSILSRNPHDQSAIDCLSRL